MVGTLGEAVVATLLSPGVPADAPLGARIEVPLTRAIVAYWRPAAYDPIADQWTVVLDPPLDGGEYNLVWRTGDPEPPAFEVFIPLSMVRSGLPAPLPPGEPPEWAPSLADVAEVAPAYTRGGFDDDGQFSGAPQQDPDTGVPTFTANTSPTAAHVEGLIRTAVEEVAGRVGTTIPLTQFGLARTTAKWHVAAVISAGKMPAGTDDASGEYRANILNFRNSLDELVRLSRMGGSRLA